MVANLNKLHDSDSGSDLVNLTTKTYPKICSEDYSLWSQIHIQWRCVALQIQIGWTVQWTGRVLPDIDSVWVQR
jgi:hypothetical protein